jgi:hypothetical protein
MRAGYRQLFPRVAAVHAVSRDLRSRRTLINVLRMENRMRKFLVFVALLGSTGIACAADAPAPAAQQPQQQQTIATLTGKVLEVKDVDSYTYLRLQTRDGELWAAVNKSVVKVGETVTIFDPAMMVNFESKALKKTFDKIVFGTLPAINAPAAQAAPAAAPHGTSTDMAAMHASMAKTSATAPDVAKIKVAKAKGSDARTVAEVATQGAALKGKPVTVHAQVVKFTPDVMGKNWVHLRDGSGSAADGSNDILVTTKDDTKIGDVVLAKGTVQTDKNFGSGYSYKVLVEDAKLSK